MFGRFGKFFFTIFYISIQVLYCREIRDHLGEVHEPIFVVVNVRTSG